MRGSARRYTVIDHFNNEIIAYNMAKTGTRFVAMISYQKKSHNIHMETKFMYFCTSN